MQRPAEVQKAICTAWLPSPKTLKTIGAFLAFLTLLAAIISLSPAFRSQSLDKQNLDAARYSAWLQYIGNCLALVLTGCIQ